MDAQKPNRYQHLDANYKIEYYFIFSANQWYIAMNILHYSAFRAVMLTGTVRGAAEILNKSQPAVSRILDRLENDLGLALFVRRKGSVTPTPEAYLLLDQVEKAYSSLESLKNFAQNLSSGEYGNVVIGSMPALGIKFIPTVLEKIKLKNPKTKHTLNVAMSSQVEEWAAFQKIDFGFAESPFTRTGFSIEVFANAPYVVAAPSDHPLSDRSSVGPKDLLEGPFISWSEFLSGKSLLEQVLYSANVKIEPRYETSLSSAAYEMVKLGLGTALLDPFTALQKPTDDNVNIIPFFPAVPFRVALLLPDTRPHSTAAADALQMAKDKRDAILRELPT